MAEKKRRSKFVTFTYIWQLLTASLAFVAFTFAVMSFIAGDKSWVIFSVQALTASLWCWIGSSWRSTELIYIETRERMAETERRIDSLI